MSRIDWTQEAEESLDRIFAGLSVYSADAAQRAVRLITQRVELLGQFPRMGRVVPEYGIERFRELIEPPYRIMYQVFLDRVEIAVIRHSSESLPPGDRD